MTLPVTSPVVIVCASTHAASSASRGIQIFMSVSFLEEVLQHPDFSSVVMNLKGDRFAVRAHPQTCDKHCRKINPSRRAAVHRHLPYLVCRGTVQTPATHRQNRLRIGSPDEG